MGGEFVHRAINHYIKEKAKKIDIKKGKDYINQVFDLIDYEIDIVKRTEVKKARKKKLRERR